MKALINHSQQMFFSFLSKICRGGIHLKCFFRKKKPSVFVWNVLYIVWPRYWVAYIWKILTEKVSREIIPMYLRLNVTLFKFLFNCATLFFNDISYPAKLCQRKVAKRGGKNFTRFCCFTFELSLYMRKGSQPRIYAD